MSRGAGIVGNIGTWCNWKYELMSLRGVKFSVLMSLLITSVVVSLVMAQWMQMRHDDYNMDLAVMIALMILFILALFGMFLFIFCTCTSCIKGQFAPNEEGNRGSEKEKDINAHFLHRLQLLLLGIFAMGGVGHDILKIVAIAQCLEETKKDEKVLNQVSLAYAFFKFMFEITQIYFIANFWKYRCQGAVARFIIGIIFAANLCSWFYVLISESVDTWNHKSMNTVLHFHQDAITSFADANPFNSTSCLNGTSRTAEMLELWQPYLYPLTMEFCLMASGLLGSMWNLKGKEKKNQPESPVQSSINMQVETSQDSSSTAQNNMLECTPHVDTLPILSSTAQAEITPDSTSHLEITSGSTDKDMNQSQHENSCCKRLKKYLCLKYKEKDRGRSCPEVFYVATVLAVLVFFLAAANQGDLWIGYCSIYMVIHFSLLLMSALAFFCMRNLKTKPAKFGPNQILLLVSTGTLLLLTLLELIPPLSRVPDLSHCENLLIATDFFLLISVFLQTLVLLKGCKKLDSGNSCLQRCFSWMAVLNLYMWFEDSIFAQKLDSALYTIHHKFYDSATWSLCKLILMPPCIFYRIHVAEMCGERFNML